MTIAERDAGRSMRYHLCVLGSLFWMLVKIVIAVVALAAMVFVASLSPNPGRCPRCNSSLGVDHEHVWENPGSGDHCNVCGWNRSDER
jgi:hypothetical protein